MDCFNSGWFAGNRMGSQPEIFRRIYPALAITMDGSRNGRKFCNGIAFHEMTLRQKVLNCGAGFQPATTYRAGKMPAPQYATLLNASSHFLPVHHEITAGFGTAYAVWTGIGTVGAIVLGIFLFEESKDLW